MGIFTEKITYVSSQVYNLAGDEDKRPNYLRTLLTGQMISGQQNSLSEAVTAGYLHGPGMRLRRYADWAARNGYDAVIGATNATMDFGDSINNQALSANIPVGAGKTVMLQKASIGWADYSNWAEQYVQANFPDLLTTAWAADFNSATGQIVIHFADSTTVSFTPSGFDPAARYLYASYTVIEDVSVGAVVTGSTDTLGALDPWPDITDWALLSDTTIPHAVTLTDQVHTVVTYSDGRPSETTDTFPTRTGNYDEFHRQYYRVVNTSRVGDILSSTRYWQYFDQTGTVATGAPVTTSSSTSIGGGVTKTTTVTTTPQEVVLTRTHRTDHQNLSQKVFSPLTTYIYQQGSGNAALDAMFAPQVAGPGFMPFIPVRLDNQFVSERFPEVYPWTSRAFRKATGSRLSKVQASVAANASLGDIDYTYVTFGVTLNVKEMACRKYLYRFFETLLDAPGSDPAAYTAWKVRFQQAYDAQGAYFGASSEDMTQEVRDLLIYPPLPVSSLRVASDDARVMNYDMTLEWSTIEELTGIGHQNPAMKVGDLWFENGTPEHFEYRYINDGSMIMGDGVTVDVVTLFWQVSANSWKGMRIRGLRHINRVYQDKSVIIKATEALLDDSESGFIVPLHEEIYRSMSIVDSTQMSTACSYLVFNCYKVVSQKWYTTGWFTFIVIIVIIIISIYFPPTAGLLGTNAAVGGALGLTGTAAVVAGFAINTLAAMALAMALQYGAKKLFGDKVGAIVGMIATIIATAAISGVMSGQTLATSLTNLASADNILMLTSSVGKGVADYVMAGVQELANNTQTFLAGVEAQLKEVNALMEQNIHSGLDLFNPMSLTGSSGSVSDMLALSETPDSFLSRTLMTGSDVADMSFSLVNDFTSITLNTDSLA